MYSVVKGSSLLTSHPRGVQNIMDAILIGLSLLALIAGALFLSEATMGIGIIAGAGVLAIYARIAQAGSHHKQIKKLLGDA